MSICNWALQMNPCGIMDMLCHPMKTRSQPCQKWLDSTNEYFHILS